MAWKKGQRYGTLVVDLLTHRPLAVLADHAAETVAAWFRRHPTIEIISRDRGGSYAAGSEMGTAREYLQGLYGGCEKRLRKESLDSELALAWWFGR